MRVNGNIPSLINGISQQPPSLRLPTQGVEQTNAISSLLDGLGKRPPAEHIAKLTSQNYVKPYVHWINRDETEKYVVLFYPEHIQVVDQFGVSYPVVETVDGDMDYINVGSPYRMIQALTINDTTFVVDQTRETKLTTDKVLARPPEAIVWIRADAGLSNPDELKVQLNFVGSMVLSNARTTNVQKQRFRYKPTTAYVVPVAVNKSGQALSSTAGNHQLVVTPYYRRSLI